jgi:hypothetical protein
MISFYADEFCLALTYLQEFERSLDSLTDGERPLPANYASEGSRIVGNFLRECHRTGLKRAVDRGDSLRYFGEIGRDQSRYTLNVIRWELARLREAALTDLRERTFLRLDDSEDAYYEKAELFGRLVGQKFPTAKYDISEAGNCYATGRYTACVFHLMRVAEHGLRRLAKSLKVPFPQTLETKEWAALIGDIENEIQGIIQKPKSLKRTKELEFYNSIAAQFRYFKDGWRNHVMHTRANYDKAQASILMVHVSEFMQHLATRIRY